MKFQYYDSENDEMTMDEVKKLELWNSTMEHIFAQTMKRVGQETSASESETVDASGS